MYNDDRRQIARSLELLMISAILSWQVNKKLLPNDL